MKLHDLFSLDVAEFQSLVTEDQSQPVEMRSDNSPQNLKTDESLQDIKPENTQAPELPDTQIVNPVPQDIPPTALKSERITKDQIAVKHETPKVLYRVFNQVQYACFFRIL
ncbi:hypothetical protein SNE40_015895 [Patella caerulea]|uniref:Uncharacterized protein n=1 Tax=Patella caerulea TaxID=87958 RepID=A0AAN8J9U3_PATCE